MNTLENVTTLDIATTTPVKLLGIGGSTRAGSRNGMALYRAMDHARMLGAETELIDLHDAGFPMLDRDRSLAEYPAVVARYLDLVRAADGFVLASPTYHGGMSGAFKNALDLLIYGDDAYFAGKPVGLLVLGGANAAPVLDQMTTIVHALKGLVVPSRVVIPHGAVAEDGTVPDPALDARLERMVTDVIALAAALGVRDQAALLPTAVAMTSR